jgi:hypothetical protein
MRLFLVVNAVLVSGCNSGPTESEARDRSFNDNRKLCRVPTIPDSWKRSATRDGTWTNPAFAKPNMVAIHASKFIAVDQQGQPFRESDYYYSGRQYQSQFDPSRLDWETITIRYDYRAAQKMRNPWYCTISCGPHFRSATSASVTDGELTLEEAETILKEWGLPRLNY